MSVVHLARARIYQEKRLNRRAFLGDFPDPIRYGVNTGIKAFYSALAVFERGCPVAQTLKGCVEISHAWEIIEE